MTVIAWDGRTLAADKQGTNYGVAYRTTKIHRVPGGLVGFSGGGGHAAALLKWFEAGRKPDEHPKAASIDDAAGATFISNDRKVYFYAHDSAHPELIEEEFYARGAGRDFALAAMYLGKNAREAVEVACAFEITCGNGIDTLTLEAT